jgi:predicted regulator of Ras-like GTPase activity (Roadblock/LC7/MglB family)
MLETPFTPILRQTVQDLPDAIGIVFADWEGEAVDRFDPRAGRPDDGRAPVGPAVDLRLWGAHWGIILHLVESALRTFHYGDPFELILQHEDLDVLIRAVTDRYYLLLALRTGGPIGRALVALRRSAEALRAEM